MRKHLPYIFILLLSVLVAACTGSKKMAKQAVKLEEAGLVEEAADFFYRSVTRNDNNIDAKVGLKRTGQIVLDNLLSEFFKANAAEDYRTATYKYIEAKDFYDKINGVGINLEFPNFYQSDFEEAKAKYLDELYYRAEDAMDYENFSLVEELTREILDLDPNYKDVESLNRRAVAEPKYREANQLMGAKKYRTAYYLFEDIIEEFDHYKDSHELMKYCREKAIYTVAFLSFDNETGKNGFEDAISAKLIQYILENRDPFIKVIDRENTAVILEEQHLALSGMVDESTAANAGNLVGAKAVLTGKLITMRVNQSGLKANRQKGYHAYSVQEKDPATGKTYSVTRYEKVYYNEYTEKNTVTIAFQYRLISSETGEVLLSDLITLTLSDDVHYARYEGDSRFLYPGTWRFENRKHPDDKVFTSSSARRQLRSLFSARSEVNSIEQIASELVDRISAQTGAQILSFNPEEK